MDILKNAAIIFLLDLPWLYAVSGWAGSVVRGIQGTPMKFLAWPAIPVYAALGYLLTYAKTREQAFALVLSVYAVYDFTNLSTFKRYPLEFAVADSLWGGVLMALAWMARQR
jgi:uncharacterized membrane protein